MTENQKQYLKRCLQLIQEKLGWGEPVDWSNMDFQRLSELIHQQTKILLSASTLKRVWGRVNYEGNPAPSTLDALAAFLGYENWRAFVSKQQETVKKEQPVTLADSQKERKGRDRKKPLLRLVCLAFLLLAMVALFYWKRATSEQKKLSPLSPKDFSFSSKPLAKGIPNSVIFTYDASHAPVDSSVFIQQTWDATRRREVSKDRHQFTAVYYEPGFYTAKLSVGQQVVQEHPLLIPSDGWLGMIAHEPIPVYLGKTDFIRKDRLELPVQEIEKNKVNFLPQAPVVKYFQVGQFDAVKVSDFVFSARLKNNYREGSGACQFSQVLLITDGAPILIPLSIKGCVSELGLMSVDQMISGKNTDLSGFGVDFSDWVKVACQGDKQHIRYYVNDRLAYELPLTSVEAKIVGMAFVFAGTGSVKAIRLGNSKGLVYQDF